MTPRKIKAVKAKARLSSPKQSLKQRPTFKLVQLSMAFLVFELFRLGLNQSMKVKLYVHV